MKTEQKILHALEEIAHQMVELNHALDRLGGSPDREHQGVRELDVRRKLADEVAGFLLAGKAGEDASVDRPFGFRQFRRDGRDPVKRRECARDCEIGKMMRIHLTGLPDDWMKDPYYSRIFRPGWRPNDQTQVKPEDFDAAREYVFAVAERYLGSREYAESFWHFNAVRKWRAVDDKTSIAELMVEFGRKLAEPDVKH